MLYSHLAYCMLLLVFVFCRGFRIVGACETLLFFVWRSLPLSVGYCNVFNSLPHSLLGMEWKEGMFDVFHVLHNFFVTGSQ